MKQILILGAQSSGKTTLAEAIGIEKKLIIFEEVRKIEQLNQSEYMRYRAPYTKDAVVLEEAIYTSNSITVKEAEKFGFKKVIVIDHSEITLNTLEIPKLMFGNISGKELDKIMRYCKITKQPLVVLVKNI